MTFPVHESENDEDEDEDEDEFEGEIELTELTKPEEKEKGKEKRTKPPMIKTPSSRPPVSVSTLARKFEKTSEAQI